MARIVKKPDERRRELIACAQKLFYAKGYERTSVNDIVSAIGVAKGTFYHYFNSKCAILEALVDELATQKRTLFQAIVDDESLDAIQKWMRVVEVVAGWKSERKVELIALFRAMYMDENMLLLYKLKRQSLLLAVPELTKIIAQGVAEGVFETPYVEEAAEIFYTILKAFSDTLADIFLHPENYDDPADLVWRKISAEQVAIERILGAAPGSLAFADEQSLATWFAD